MKCLQCGKKIIGRKNSAKYCDDLCGQRYWRRMNPEKVKFHCMKYMLSEKGKLFRIKYKEKLNENCKKWVKENREYWNEYCRNWRKNNIRYKVKYKLWHEANKEKMRKYHRKYYLEKIK